jgi:hypothetical protein
VEDDMEQDKFSEILLDQIHILMKNQADLKASVDAHIEKIQDMKSITVKHETLLNHHAVLFKVIFWISTTVGGLAAAWAIKFK